MKYNTKKPGNSQALFIDSNNLFNLWFWGKNNLKRALEGLFVLCRYISCKVVS